MEQPSPSNEPSTTLTASARDAKAVEKKPPETLEEAQREILRLVCANSAAMTQAVINDALQGRYLSVKFLFEFVGLSVVEGEDAESPRERESLASLLLKRWQNAPQAGSVTEVSEVTSAVAAVGQAPVEL